MLPWENLTFTFFYRKLIDVSQSPGGILDWREEPEQENESKSISKLKQIPHSQLCRQIFDLTNIQNSTVEELAYKELIRPEEIDMLIHAMNQQESSLQEATKIRNVGDLVVRLKIEGF